MQAIILAGGKGPWLKQSNNKIGRYQRDYYWFDIGRVDDYEKAVEIFKEKKDEFLPK